MTAPAPRVALITGASSGIGQACATLLAAHGLTVYGTARQAQSAPEGCTLIPMDVTRDDSVKQAVGEVLTREGRIDVVVNNAGYGLAGSIEDTSLDEARLQFETNFFGVMRVCKAVLPTMRQLQAGLIVNISSLGGAIGLPFQGLYSASKFALEGFTEALRQEVRPFGIHAVLIQPGDIQTRITQNRVRAQATGPGSTYQEHFEGALKVIEREEQAGIPPTAVAQQVLRLVTGRSFRVRYRVGRLSQTSSVAAKAILPSGMFEKALMSFYGL
ncbi:SDR family oxidoreductase [Myxococcaceae bacterium JPH2]|nr:SDR family oxidoreductase [Myxococcaceae bacterium JPH2]